MKFCYIDESGTGDEPFAVMVGVLIDAYRMRPTKAEWDDLLSSLSEITGKEIKEFHTKDFYAGNSPWRGLKGHERAEIITTIFDWYAQRGHHIVYTIIDRNKFNKTFEDHEFSESIGNLWKTLELHIALALQKNHQSLKNNKGHTLLVFDAHVQDERNYAELLLEPPEWTETYYAKGKKQKPLDQIIDVPHFVDSAHVGMIQLADCISYFLRRHVEIIEGAVPARYEGEDEVVAKWVEVALGQSIPSSAIYPKKGRCEASEFFYQLAPESIKG
jgi:hypothetical protein